MSINPLNIGFAITTIILGYLIFYNIDWSTFIIMPYFIISLWFSFPTKKPKPL